MELTRKIVPFSVELAKQIVRGEKLGRIVTVDGTPVTILAFDLNGEQGKPIVVRGRSMLDSSKECVYEVGEDGVYMKDHDMPYADLAIEIPEANVMTVGVDRPFDQIIPNPNHRPGVMGDYRFATKQDMEQGLYTPDNTPKDEFRPYEKVLVREHDTDEWQCDYFSHAQHDGVCTYYICVGGEYLRCIPYEGNEHLVGQVDDPRQNR